MRATDYFNWNDWWYRLFEDSNFWQKYIDRWYELRKGPFSTENINSTIDTLADEIREAQARHYAKWGESPRFSSFQGEIDNMKWWLTTRTTWVDDQFVKPPQVTPDGGYIEAGSTVSMSNPNGSGTIYYTIDGNDPRLPEGEASTTSTTLVSEDDTKRVLVPTGPVNDVWRGGQPFDDSGWNHGTPTIPGKTGGVGYEASSGYEDYITYDVEAQMNNLYTTCYIRIPFTVDACDLNGFNFMMLKIRYDDGFVAYLNGDPNELARRNFTGTPAWDSAATSQHDDYEAVNFENIPVSGHISSLKQGDNILAIHGLNYGTSSSDFLISVELLAGETDPGGMLSDSAIAYSTPFTLAESTQVKARVLVGSNPYSLWSGLAKPTFAVGPVAESLRITEIMYHPQNTNNPNDPNDPNEEFIELRNIGPNTLNLKLVSFTDGIYFTFPSLELDPNECVLIVEDQNAFEAKYGADPNIAGEYSGKLANDGEQIRLEDANGQAILDFSYNDGWYDITDGAGFSLTIKDPNIAEPNAWSEKKSWRPSARVGGSPGWDDTGQVPELGSVKINELLAHSHATAPDWIELHNTTAELINIGGWFLSDNDSNLTKYEIAEGTTIDQNDYIVFYQDQHFDNPNDPGCNVRFAMSENGETLYLHSGQDGELTGYSEEEEFGASETGVAFGRYLKSTGTYNFVAMSENTPRLPNAYPKVGPIVINEIMYHPNDPSGDAEYVELLNISGSPVTLYDYSINEPWQFVDDEDDPGIEFLFPDNPSIIMADGEYLLLVRNLAAFNAKFTAPGGVTILQWVNGRLKNGREKPQISKPGDVNAQGQRQYIRVDRIHYSDGMHHDDFDYLIPPLDPWPIEADGSGKSLNRKVPTEYGNDVINWEANEPTPGDANP
ncbi:MAG: lamin tail domain-containing protein [Planctomycetota bacterium]